MDARLAAAVQMVCLAAGVAIGWKLGRIVAHDRERKIWNKVFRESDGGRAWPAFVSLMADVEAHNRAALREVARMQGLHYRFASGPSCWCGSRHPPEMPTLTPEDIQRMNDLANGKP